MRHISTVTVFAVLLAGLARAEPFEYNAWELDGPELLPWKTITPDPAYHGQWLVAGDLNGDGQAEIVTARQDGQRVTTVLATRLDGSVLWTWGRPNTGVPQLNYDVPVQVYDLEGDGSPEVYLSVEGYLLGLDGLTGKERRRLELPDGLTVADCIAFANLRGGPHARDLILKDRYSRIWAYTDDWRLLWHWQPAEYKTCHHPTVLDLDGDGRDEVVGGYTLLNHDGREQWTMTSARIDPARGHLDCCEVLAAGKKPEDYRIMVSYCGADGLAMVDGTGKTLWEIGGRHFESIDVGRVRNDLPGRQIVVDIAHQPYRKGSIWLIDSDGNRLGTYLCGDSRHHRLIDWDGDGVQEILVAQERRLLDGKGQCIAQLGPDDAFRRTTIVPPDQDHEPFALLGDLDGDERPEIILYSMKQILVYRNEKAAKVPALKRGTGVNVTLY